MRRLGTRILAITMAAAMMTSLTPQASAFLQREIVYAAEQETISGVVVNATIDDPRFDPKNTWSNETGETQIDLKTTENLKKGTGVSFDVLIPEEKSSFGNQIQIQAIFRLGSKPKPSWDELGIAKLDSTSFTDTAVVDGKNYKKANVSFTCEKPSIDDVLNSLTLKGAGYLCNYSGEIKIANAKLVIPGEEKREDLVFKYNKGESLVFDFSKSDAEDWKTPPTISLSGAVDSTIEKKSVWRGSITIDKETYDSLSVNKGYIKISTVMKVGKEDDWSQSNDYPYLDKDKFTEDADGKTYSAPFETAFKTNGGKLYDAYFRIHGILSKGSVTLSDVKIYNVVSSDAPLPAKEATDIDNFDSYAVDAGGDVTGWNDGGTWQYSNTVTPVVSETNGSKALKLNLDYSKDSAYDWSEAKVTRKFTTGFDVSAYNQLTYDIIYPSAFDGFKAKVFAKNMDANKTIIDKLGVISDKVSLDGGLTKATVTVKFTPNENLLDELTIGTVGVNTDFVGNVFVDNIKLSQYDPSADFVEIKITADNAKAKETSVNSDRMDTTVSLADQNATPSTLALYSYLKNLDTNNQVLFGHQNDTHKSVNPKANEGDTKDVTGSISGIVGIDSLALTGTELGLTDTKAAVAKSIEIGKKVADQGGILTLSTHMPNMSNAKIVNNEDGTFDFSACDFAESKDLSNMEGSGAKEVLPGGKYNAQFTAYLDIIAEYAKGLQEENIPVLFRPFHEGDGNWFWWGAADDATYKAVFRYTEDYLEEQGVHNFIYVYSPCGPTSENTYMNRYPGDDYVDVLSFDYYDDYSGPSAAYTGSFFTNLKSSCEIIKKYADDKGKVAAIAEAGVRVTKADGSDSEGLLVKNNPIKGKKWYSEINEVAKETGMSYFLLWANFSDTNFYIPYKYNDTKGQELINEFIDFYNEDSSIFADGTNFYGTASTKTVTNSNKGATPSGYITSISSKDAITAPTTLEAKVKNAKEVKFVLTSGKVSKEITAVKAADSTAYSAPVTTDVLSALGTTDQGTIDLVADGKFLSTLTYISFNKEKDVLPANVIENFDLYFGDNAYLGSNFSSNGSGGSSATITLDAEHAKSGTNAGVFTYTLKDEGAYAGKIKTEDYDFSGYNALQMWVEPDGMGQKLIIQIGDASGEEYEVSLAEFVKGTKGQYVTIPFASFKPKNGGTLNTSKITKFAIYCNRIDTDVTDSKIYFDEIQAVNVTDAEIAQKNEAGIILTDEAIGTTTPIYNNPSNPSSDTGSTTTTETKPDGSKVETKVETKPDGSKVETVTTTKPDGTQSIVVSEQETNEAGKTVAVTTTTEKDAKGNVTGTTEEKVIAEADKNTSVTVTTKTDSEGQSEVTASVVKTGTKTVSGTNSTISSAVVAQITEAAGTEDAVITQKVVDKAGKTICTTMVNASDLTPGSNLKIFKYNTKTGEYTLVNKKDYKVTGKGGIKLTMKSSGTFMFLNQKDADEVVNKILATVKSANASKTLSKGKTANFVMSKKLNMANVAKITYSSSESSVAKIDKNGKITAKKAGTAIVKAEVTLKNGKTKTISMKVKVK